MEKSIWRSKDGFVCGGCKARGLSSGCGFMIGKRDDGPWNVLLDPNDGDCQQCLEDWERYFPEARQAEIDRVVRTEPDVDWEKYWEANECHIIAEPYPVSAT